MPLHVVKQGEHLEGIAHRLGCTPDVIWDDPANAVLRELRVTGAILRAGDVLVVPEARPPRRASLRVGDTNAFKANIPKTRVSLKFVNATGPIANQPFTVEAEGQKIEGTSDGEGKVEFDVRVGTRRARVLLKGLGDAYDLELGGLDPVTTVSGAQMRLRHLALYAGPTSGVLDDRTADALRAFQRDRGLATTGALDEPTIEALREAHGS